MAKIIKEKDFDGRCMKCGCYFEYVFDDIMDELDQEGCVIDTRPQYVKCPKCGAHVINIWHNGSVKK